jgi:hypothetical protein
MFPTNKGYVVIMAYIPVNRTPTLWEENTENLAEKGGYITSSC